jgi:hypothetical protein
VEATPRIMNQPTGPQQLHFKSNLTGPQIMY